VLSHRRDLSQFLHTKATEPQPSSRSLCHSREGGNLPPVNKARALSLDSRLRGNDVLHCMAA